MRFLQYDGKSYRNIENYGLLLDQRLCAVHVPSFDILLFRDSRAVNSFLPISENLKIASEREVRELLEHDRLATEDVERWAKKADFWFRKNFVKLKESGILDRYSVDEIKSRSTGYNISIQQSEGRIVFPSDYKSAKKLLRFLNEELYQGVFTGMVYEVKTKGVSK